MRRIPKGASKADEGGHGLAFNDPEPWPDPVASAYLLDSLIGALHRHIVLSEHCAVVVALWAIHCHAFETWQHTPRLNITAPEKGCGKSTLLDVLACLVPRPIKTDSVSTAVLFRIIEKARPTMLIDEVDSFLRDNEELRGCLNAGHRRGGKHLRCVGDDNEVKAFNTFAPAALAGIGALPGTLADRSLTIVLQRRRPDQQIDNFRDDRADHLRDLHAQIVRWTLDNQIALASAEPALPDGIHNRLADNWRPLFAIAAVAGGGWIDRARAAARFLVQAGGDTGSIRERLLSDIRDAFQVSGRDKLSSEEITTRLHQIEDGPWAEYGRSGKPMTKVQMARLLKPFTIAPGTIRDGGTTMKGYRLSSFRSAFSSYLPNRTVTPAQPAETLGLGQNRNVTPELNVTDENPPKPQKSGEGDGVTDENPPGWENST